MYDDNKSDNELIIAGGIAVAALAYIIYTNRNISVSNEIMLWLDQKLIEWKPAGTPKIGCGTYHVFASDEIFVKTDASLDIKFLEMLEETNANLLSLYVRPDEFSIQKTRYMNLINKIKLDGKKLFVGLRFNDGQLSLSEYDTLTQNYINNVIDIIKPDYFGIVIEPTTMEDRHTFNATDEQWVQYIQKYSDLSKQLNPSIKTVVAGHKKELNFLQLCANIPSLDIIGFNIYDRLGIDPNLDNYIETEDISNAIDYVNSKGKETWIVETWTSFKADPDPTRMPYDTKWLRVMIYYAINHNMKMFIPFFTGKFIIYTDSETEFESALYAGTRTPVFYEYQTLVTEYQQ